jgi:hypothetical protein
MELVESLSDGGQSRDGLWESDGGHYLEDPLHDLMFSEGRGRVVGRLRGPEAWGSQVCSQEKKMSRLPALTHVVSLGTTEQVLKRIRIAVAFEVTRVAEGEVSIERPTLRPCQCVKRVGGWRSWQ